MDSITREPGIGNREAEENHGGINQNTDVPVEIGTDHPPNTNLNRCRRVNLLGTSSVVKTAYRSKLILF
jgi:hypothetical protein